MTSLLETIRERRLLCDGAMGTQLQLAGLEPGGCGEVWNLTHPERIVAIQRAYVEAGSDCLTTNTFGGCRITLARHGKADDVTAINRAAAEVAREAFGGKPGFVIGDIGPFGGLMEPYGDVAEADVRTAFREQAEALLAGGADALIVETQTSLEELKVGLEEARAAGCDCVIGSMAFDVGATLDDIHTVFGVNPAAAAEFIAAHGGHIVALNCGTGMDMAAAAKALEQFAAHSDLPLMAQPNAGQPEIVDMQVVYKQSPEDMAAGVPDVLAAGARIIGGCCGSTPDHIRRMRAVLDAT